MISWLSAAPVFLAASALLLLPGLLVVTAAGGRGLRAVVLAVPTTFTGASLWAIVAEKLGIGFSLLSFCAASVVLAALCWAVALLWRRRGGPPRFALPWRPDAAEPLLPGRRAAARANAARSAEAGDTARGATGPRSAETRTAVWALVGVAAAAVLIGGRLIRSIGDPEAIAQLFDNVYHLNAVAQIAETGAGSSLTIGNLNEASRSFYPAAFHDVTALLVGAGVADVPVAINAVTVLLAAVVWPMSAMFLTTRIFGRRPEILLLTGVLAAAFAAFPYRLFSFGVLYSFFAALTMLPVLVGLILEFFGESRGARRPMSVVVISVLAVAPGIALCHPSAIVAGLLLAGPFAVSAAVRALLPAGRGESHRALVVTLAGLYLAAALIIFLKVRPPLDSAPWTPTQSLVSALGRGLRLGPGDGGATTGLIVLAAVGAITVLARPGRLWPVAASVLIGVTIYVAAAAVQQDWLRTLLSGVWYRDTIRVAALSAIASLPLAVLGGAALVELATRLLGGIAKTREPRRLQLLAVVVIAAIAVGSALATQRSALRMAGDWISQSFGQQRGTDTLLTGDERQLLAELPELVPADETVLGNPQTGASLSPAFSDRATVAPHVFGQRTAQEQMLLDHWDDAGSDPEVCDAVRALGAYWALDFGDASVLIGDQSSLAGTDALAEGPPAGIEEIARVGDAALYEAKACR